MKNFNFQSIKYILLTIGWIAAMVIGYFVLSDNSEAIPEASAPSATSVVNGFTTTTTPIPESSYTTTVSDGLESLSLPASTPNQTVSYPGFTVYYNSNRHSPTCVVYTLTASETRGRASRRDQFVADDTVKGCAQSFDYSGSGYDRGHMAPAGDFKWSDKAITATFMMSNICPLDHDLNKYGWNDLELKVREWARRDKKLIVYTGPVYTSSKPRRIGKRNRITVPDAFFKVIYAPTARPERAIAFLMPNEPCNDDLKTYVVTVDEVERLTGLDFLASLPKDRQQRLQATSNATLWFHSR